VDGGEITYIEVTFVLVLCISFRSNMAEYKEALDIVNAQHNLCILGPAGTGKTYLIKQIHTSLCGKGKKVAVTASTGVAANNVGLGAVTIHKWAGICDGRYDDDELIRMINTKQNKLVNKRIKETNTLIIDEISMISAKIFDQVELVCRTARENSQYFGGMQIILVGDFRQLKPVASKLYNDLGKFAFQSNTFKECITHKIVLKTYYRQEDEHFIDVIKQLSLGHPSEETDRFLVSLDRELDEPGEALHLFPDNLGCAQYNLEKLEALDPDTPITYYQSTDTGKPNLKHQISRHLALKPGAPVMLRVNLSANLINGKLGVVRECLPHSVKVDFDGEIIEINMHTFEIYSCRVKKVLSTRTQLPLTLAWAITIHKSQGLTLNRATIHCKGINKAGQLAVAVSRVRKADHVRLIGYRRSQAPQHLPCISQYYGSPSSALQDNHKCCNADSAGSANESSDRSSESSDKNTCSNSSTGDDFSDFPPPSPPPPTADSNQDPSEIATPSFKHIVAIMEAAIKQVNNDIEALAPPPSNLAAVGSLLKIYKTNNNFLACMQRTYLELKVIKLSLSEHRLSVLAPVFR
jgi:hypothetical protein